MRIGRIDHDDVHIGIQPVLERAPGLAAIGRLEHIANLESEIHDVRVGRIDGNAAERELLWAIKGGGGFSYGIVTELVIRTFELPWEMYRFSITWNADPRYPADPTRSALRASGTASRTPTRRILKAWEQAILQTDSDQSNQIVGTNLKIYARPLGTNESFDPETSCHGCVMYGYWEGDRESLLPFIDAIAAAAKTPIRHDRCVIGNH